MVKEPSQRYNQYGNTFIILHRKLLSSAIFENPNELKIWIWCLLRANFTQRTIFFGSEEIKLDRGQFVFGRFTAAGELKMNPSTIYKILKKLEKAGMIEIKSNNKKSLLSIINYEVYQDNGLQKEQQSNNRVTTKEQQSNTDNNDNKKNNENNVYITKSRPQSLIDVALYFEELKADKSMADAFYDHYESNGWKIGGKSPMKDWKAAVRNWIRNSKKWSNNGTTQSTVKKSDQTARATFRHTEEQLRENKELTESIGLLYTKRD